MLVIQRNRKGGESMIHCPFCGGVYVEKQDRVSCLMCDRTMDIKYELYVQKEQKKPHKNWHIYATYKLIGRERKNGRETQHR